MEYDFKEIEKATGYREIKTQTAVEVLRLDILATIHRENPKNDFEKDLNAKALALYKSLAGEYFVCEPNAKNPALLLLGVEEQDKTAAFSQAAQEVSQALGLNLVKNPNSYYAPKENDFIFYVYDIHNKNLEPDEILGSVRRVFTKILPAAAGGLMVFDDVLNVNPMKLDMMLSLLEDKQFQGIALNHIHFGLVGDLGSMKNADKPDLFKINQCRRLMKVSAAFLNQGGPTPEPIQVLRRSTIQERIYKNHPLIPEDKHFHKP